MKPFSPPKEAESATDESEENEPEPMSVSTDLPLVAYGQITDVQKIFVDYLSVGKVKELHTFMSSCCFFLDECDHVLTEQAESLLYIASPCPSFQSLQSLLLRLLYSIDYVADFCLKEVETFHSVPKKASKLASKLLKELRQEHVAERLPHIVDSERCISSWSGGALVARLKRVNEDFLLDVSSKDDPGLTGTCKITIVDLATGVESYGTRWTNEAPFVEGLSGLPMGGSEPLAYFSSLPYILQKCRWFCGVTGTLGGSHNLSYYAKTYDVQSSFRIPRNRANCVYHLPILASNSEEEWANNIKNSVRSWISKQSGVEEQGSHFSSIKATGPILIVTQNIRKAEMIVNELMKDGHVRMMTNDNNEWVCDNSAHPDGRPVAHLFPYYRGEHLLDWKEDLPDNVIVVATNKGGRALDLKVGGDCGDDCGIPSHIDQQISANSVLFVILTVVLLGRQDEQAQGRCGRLGKGGVIQYNLHVEKEPCKDPEYTFFKGKQLKDLTEQNDLGFKSVRIAQNRHNCWVLDRFCLWKPVYAKQWMLKLATKEEVEEKETLSLVLHSVEAWFHNYLQELWAYWLCYSGTRRSESDTFVHFRSRMGLCAVRDLDSAKEETAKKLTIEEAFTAKLYKWVTSLRVSADALYALAKSLLMVKDSTLGKALCISILSVVSDRQFQGVPLLPVGAGNQWRPEMFGNGAILLAGLLKKPFYVTQACEQVMSLIEVFESDTNFNQQSFIEAVYGVEAFTLSKRVPVRTEMNYYVAQRSEIVRQLRYRKQSLERASYEWTLELHHFSEAMNDPDTAVQAYALGLEFCQVVFEFYVGDSPFTCPSVKGTEMQEHFIKKAEELGGGLLKSSHASLSSGGGDAQVLENNTSKTAYRDSGTALMEAVHRSLNEGDELSAVAKITPVIDGSAGEISYCERMWLTTTATFASLSRPQFQYKVVGETPAELPAWMHMNKETKTQVREAVEKYSMRDACFSTAAAQYLTHSAVELNDLISKISVPQKESDLIQAQVDPRMDGTCRGDAGYFESKRKADEASKNSPYLQDETLTKPEVYLINNMLEELCKLASKDELGHFSVPFAQMMQSIHHFNVCATSGTPIDPQLVSEINRAMKEMKRKVLQLALNHGTKLQSLHTALKNYTISTRSFGTRLKQHLFRGTSGIDAVTTFFRQVNLLPLVAVEYVNQAIRVVEWQKIAVYFGCFALLLHAMLTGLVSIISFINFISVFLMVQCLYDIIRYVLQGRGEIEATIWGNSEFDIIDMSKHPNGIRAHLLKIHAGLKRVWMGGPFLWWFDPSLKMGIDVDERENVQHDQERANEMYLERKDKIMRVLKWAGLILAFLVTLPFSTVFALFSAAAMGLEALYEAADGAAIFTEDERKQVLTYISIAKGVLGLLTLYTSTVGTATMLSQLKSLSTIPYEALMVVTSPNIVLEYLHKLLSFHSSAHSILHQLEKAASLFGLGGRVAQYGVQNFADFLNWAINDASSFWSLLDNLRNIIKKLRENKRNEQQRQRQQQQEQEQQQQQQQQEQSEQDDNDENQSGNNLTWYSEIHSIDYKFKDGETLKYSEVFKRVSCEGSSLQKGKQTSSSTIQLEYLPVDSNAAKLVVKVSHSQDGDAWKVEFSRELTNQEKLLFDKDLLSKDPDRFLKQLTAKNEAVEVSFRNEVHEQQLTSKKTMVSCKSRITTPKGELMVIKDAKGCLTLTVTLEGVHPTPKVWKVTFGQKGELDCTGSVSKTHVELLLGALYRGEGCDDSVRELCTQLDFNQDDGVPVPKGWLDNPKLIPENLLGKDAHERTLQALQYALLKKGGMTEEQWVASLKSRDTVAALNFIESEVHKSVNGIHDKELLLIEIDSLLKGIAVNPLTEKEQQEVLIQAEKDGVMQGIMEKLEKECQKSNRGGSRDPSAGKTIHRRMVAAGASSSYDTLKLSDSEEPLPPSKETDEVMMRCEEDWNRNKESDKLFAGFSLILSHNEIKERVQDLLQKGNWRGLTKFVNSISDVHVPELIVGTPQERAYQKALADQQTRIYGAVSDLIEKGFFGDYEANCVRDAADELVRELVGFIGNTRMHWSDSHLTQKINDANTKLLEKCANYKSKNKRIGHLQEVLISISFNNLAVKEGSVYRLVVNPTNNAVGGEDLLMIDIRTGEVIKTLESKYSGSDTAAVGNFKQHTVDPNSAKYYDPDTTHVVTLAERLKSLQKAYPQYTFSSTIPVSDAEDARSLQLSDLFSSKLVNQIENLKNGEHFTIKGPRNVKDSLTVVISRGSSGNVTVTPVPQ